VDDLLSARAVPLDAVRGAIARCWLGGSLGAEHVEAGRDAPGESGPCAAHLGSIVLRPHQVAAVRELRAILRAAGGAVLADDVGTGKTYVALALARDARAPAVVAPAGLRAMWDDAAARAGVSLALLTTESLSRGSARPHLPEPCDLLVVDEAHHFRNARTARYRALMRLSAQTPVLLVTATPVHNRTADLATLLGLFLGGRAWTLTDADRSRYVVRRRVAELRPAGGGPSGDARGTAAHWPAVDGPHLLRSADDADTAQALVELPPALPARGAGEAGALAVIGLMRQWASSAGALRAALERRAARAAALAAALESGRHPSDRELRAWCVGEGAQQLAFPELLVPAAPVAEGLLDALRAHAEGVRRLASRLARAPDPDIARADRLRAIVAAHAGTPVVAFSGYEDTVRALYRLLVRDVRVCALTAGGGTIVGGRLSRAAVTAQLARDPRRPGSGSAAERIDLLLTTDLLSEGVNLHAAGVVVHLDLPWTPARLEQRVGRVARMGNPYPSVTVYAFAPPASSEVVLQLERRLHAKVAAAARAVGMAGSIVPSLVAGLGDGVPGRVSLAAGLPECTATARDVVRAWGRRWASRLARGGAQGPWGAGRPAADRVCANGGPVEPGGGDESDAGDRAVVYAAVRGTRPGFLAAGMLDGRPVLIGSTGGSASDAPDIVAAAVQAADSAGGAPAAPHPAALRGAADALQRWWAARRATDTVGLTDLAAVGVRHRVLRRIASVVRRTPAHARPRILALASRARRAATAPFGAGAEGVLRELADAQLPEVAWLRAVGAFGDAFAARHAASLGHDRESELRIGAVLLIVQEDDHRAG